MHDLFFPPSLFPISLDLLLFFPFFPFFFVSFLLFFVLLFLITSLTCHDVPKSIEPEEA